MQTASVSAGHAAGTGETEDTLLVTEVKEYKLRGTAASQTSHALFSSLPPSAVN